jgi:hypothetical protein
MAALPNPWPTKPLFEIGQKVWCKEHRHYKLTVTARRNKLVVLPRKGWEYLVRLEKSGAVDGAHDDWLSEKSLIAVSALDLLAEIE